MSLDDLNGHGIAEEWQEHRLESTRAFRQVDEIHTQFLAMGPHMKNLEKLEYLKDIKESLLSAAVGKNQIEAKLAKFIFSIFGAVILGLAVVIVFLLTGEHLGIIGALHR